VSRKVDRVQVKWVNKQFLMDYWWFLPFNFDELWSRPDPTRNVLSSPDHKYGTEGFRAALKEANMWMHMSPEDCFRCESAFNSGATKTAILSGRLASIDFESMQLESIYWPGTRCLVRRTNWLIVVGAGTSIIPCPNILAGILDSKYESVMNWIEEEPQESLVEKIVDLERPFHDHMMIVRRGLRDQIFLCPITTNSSVYDYKKSSQIQIVRGYSRLASLFPSLNIPQAKALNDITDTIPKHLILAVHGIGQKFAGKFGYGFVRDTSFLREQLGAAEKQSGKEADSIAILPIHWRLDLKLPAHYYRNEGTPAMSGFDLVLSRMVPPSVPLIRSLFSDVALDILLYMAPKHRDLIINGLLRDLRRIYDLFMAWNPGFLGKVHLFGHSLGSTIIADMLANNLCPFPVDNCFAVGSPAPLFFLLKHQRPIGCRRLCAPTAANYEGEESPEAVSFSCQNYFNIYHPNDPIAYRMEPLVDHELGTLLAPSPIPYNKPGLTKLKMNIDERIGKAREDFSSAFKYFTSRLMSPTSPTTASADSTAALNDASRGQYPAFNGHGRIDFALQDSLMESAYLSSLSAHFIYWSDFDVAMFIAKQLL
jgi:hypothetical protein